MSITAEQLKAVFQRFVLGKSRLQKSVTLTNLLLEARSDVDISKLVRNDMSLAVSREIVKKIKIHEEPYTFPTGGEGTRFFIDFLVFEHKDLKDVVEATIQLLTDEDIKKIRENNILGDRSETN